MATDNINYPNFCNICGKVDCIHTLVDPKWVLEKGWKTHYLGYYPANKAEADKHYSHVSHELPDLYLEAKYQELLYKEKQLQKEKYLIHKEKYLIHKEYAKQSAQLEHLFPYDIHYDPSPAHLADKNFLYFIEAPKRIPYDHLIKVIKT